VPTAGDARGWMPEEISGQIGLTRELNPGSGHVHFSMVALNQNRRGLNAHLLATRYQQAALPPVMPWLPDRAPGALTLTHVQAVGGDEAWQLDGDGGRRWLAWRTAGGWRPQLIGAQQRFAWPADAIGLVASAISTTGIEGPRRAWTRT
jgi:hypothetical protein